jgi:phage-related tail protein
MVITQQDLQDWNSNPVTKAIFASIENSLQELRQESCLRSTSDETAMTAARQVGIAEGINSLKEAYEILEEDSE